ncbi:MAG: DUF3096 domain-containing protein [Candidatus Buchananbacteria bacterium]
MTKVKLQFVKNLVWGLVSEGVIAILFGILIMVYPELLSILVGLALIVTGVVSLSLAIRANKYSSIEF